MQNVSIGTVCSFLCQEGTSKSGPDQRTCTLPGVWDGTTVECTSGRPMLSCPCLFPHRCPVISESKGYTALRHCEVPDGGSYLLLSFSESKGCTALPTGLPPSNRSFSPQQKDLDLHWFRLIVQATNGSTYTRNPASVVNISHSFVKSKAIQP